MDNNLTLMPRKSLIRHNENKNFEIIEENHNVNIEDLYVAPTDWNFYGDISAMKMNELMNSILEVGILHPIIVWERPNEENKKYMILSGHNRVKAYKFLYKNTGDSQYIKINAIIKRNNEITEDIAKQIIIDTNWVQRELTPIQKAKSIVRKYVYIKEYSNKRVNVNEIIGKEYNLKKKQLINYKSLLNLIEEIQPYVDDGKISIKAGVKISKLTEETQKSIYDKYISKGLFKIINAKSIQITESMDINEINEILSSEETKIKMKIVIKDISEDIIVSGSQNGLNELKRILEKTSEKLIFT